MTILLEYEAKEILQKEGIPIPIGKVATTSEEVRTISKKVGKPVVLKVQVPTGRRGKARGIQFAETPEEAENIAEELLNMEILGFKVTKLLIEEKLEINKELYIGIINDRTAKAPRILVSSEGGMEIEKIAEKFPEKLAGMAINIQKGIQPFHARNLAKKAGIPSELIGKVGDLLYRLYLSVYRGYDASLIEVNPLCLTADNQLIAADARLNLDDNARFRHKDVKPEMDTYWNEREKIAHEKGFGYVELDPNGEIACIANGAGIGMSVMDYINESVKLGTLACFLDVGGRFYDLTGDALKLCLTLPNLKAVLIHDYGGVTRCDILAESVCRSLREIKPKVPIFLNVSGTGEKEAIEILKKEAPELRKLGVIFEWTSHCVVGIEDSSARKGGIDVIEYPVKRVVEWCGYQYKRNPPEWLTYKAEWEELTRKRMREYLPQRPETEYQQLAKYE